METATTQQQSCRFCLKTVNDGNFKEIGSNIREVLTFLSFKLTLDNKDNHVMCNDCFVKLFAAYNFKVTCLDSEDCILRYVNSHVHELFDMKEIYLKEKGTRHLNSIIEDLKVCRMCIKSVASGFLSLEELDMGLTNEYIPEVNLSCIKDPIICKDCFESLNSHCRFLKMCLDLEDKNEQNDLIHIKNEEIEIKLEKNSTVSEFEDEITENSDIKINIDDIKDAIHDNQCVKLEMQPLFGMDLISKYKDFSRLNIDEKLEIKRNGRPVPDLNIEVNSTSRGKSYARKFNKNIYEKYGWICGCEVKNKLFCFVCVLFGGETHWTISGVDDLVHLSEKAKLHGNSKQHLTNQMRLTLLGKRNIQEQLGTAYWRNIEIHNEKVAKNRFVLSKLVEAIKFCGTFELALRGHDESKNSENPGIFQGLINYTAEIDKTLKEHLQGATATVFKGTSQEIQNNLLDCIFEVYREVVSTEIQNADFLGIMADETTDVSSKLQTVLVFRYVKDGKAVERFWGFFTSEQQTAEVLSQLILKELEPLVAKNPKKLIAQSYDGAAVMSGKQNGVQAKIKEKYPVAHFVHCYAHQLNLIMSRAASQNNDVRLFFGNISEIPTFFSDSSQHVAFLDRIVKRKRPRSVPTRWNFKSRTVNVVFEYKEDLIECMEEIEETRDVNMSTKTQAGAIRRLLQEKSFIFWLTFFHYVMPHVDILFNELQKRIIDSAEINICLKKFKKNISSIRNKKIYDILNEARAVQVIETKRRKLNEDTWKASAIEVCDVIINVAEDRFTYTNQLNAANLFICEKFEWYDRSFPHDYFKKTIESYPMLEKNRLKTELTVLYSSTEYRNLSSCAVLLNFLIDSNLQEVFTETITLLQILVTMPMTTVEAERSFSSVKRIKTFLRSTMSQDRLNALACLSIEQKLIRSIPDFNQRVIDKFALKKDRHIDLILKKN